MTCGKSFTEARNLKNHKHRIHEVNKDYKCDRSKEFKSESNADFDAESSKIHIDTAQNQEDILENQKNLKVVDSSHDSVQKHQESPIEDRKESDEKHFSQANDLKNTVELVREKYFRSLRPYLSIFKHYLKKLSHRDSGLLK